ncbi:MAG: hypothetical protein AAGD96_21160 [Chloroflexota bacterium]
MVTCAEFPIVIITSNNERELPSPFLRRCLSYNVRPPERSEFIDIVESHLGRFEDKETEVQAQIQEQIGKLIDQIIERRNNKEHVATDQLLNAAYLLSQDKVELSQDLAEKILKKISNYDPRTK